MNPSCCCHQLEPQYTIFETFTAQYVLAFNFYHRTAEIVVAAGRNNGFSIKRTAEWEEIR